MNVILRDDFNLSENESEYFSGTDEASDESFNEVSDPLYEGDTESNSFDQQSISGSSVYEQSIEDVDDYLTELKSDSYDDSENELEIFKEDGTDAEVTLREFGEYLQNNDNEEYTDSFDDSDSEYDEELISYIIRNTKYQLKKMIMALSPMMLRKF